MGDPPSYPALFGRYALALSSPSSTYLNFFSSICTSTLRYLCCVMSSRACCAAVSPSRGCVGGCTLSAPWGMHSSPCDRRMGLVVSWAGEEIMPSSRDSCPCLCVCCDATSVPRPVVSCLSMAFRAVTVVAASSACSWERSWDPVCFRVGLPSRRHVGGTCGAVTRQSARLRLVPVRQLRT
jgi:hypothetical protein